ncbi:LCP family protein [Effusibacillus lacus]|uniref:SH3b domain-containing protein n=1 Tax=Effusibacillus lacus TaxID=1348429 RepID=A0A292YCN7_9BACL|nr:LCP family protein [Effusibacillus lacus]TCS70841.1 LytR family transcriptional attenuator [Effusibacillus lacus]GAX89362.1 hypothetical protein EFBL_0980 [Effusibacillus lacus]
MDFEQDNGTEQHQELRRSSAKPPKRKRKRFRNLLLLLAAFFIGLAAYNIVAVLKFLDKANQNRFANVGNTVTASEWSGSERVNVLFLGVDNRDKDEAPRSDTMLLLSIDPATDRADLMSIMRDTYVKIPGHGMGKINTAFAIGGPSLTVRTIGEFLQVPVHYYVVTDFKGFEGVIDAIGGVQLNVEIPMKYTDDGVYDIDLKKGPQHLTGREALQYVRYRGDARADFARTERQRKLVKAVLEELKTPLTLVRFPSMLKEAEPYVQTNMMATDVMRLSTDVLALNSGSINSFQIPPDELLTETFNQMGEAILQPDVKAVQKFVREKMGTSSSVPVNSTQGTVPASGTSKPSDNPAKPPAESKNGAGTSANSPGGFNVAADSGHFANERIGKVTDGVNVRQGPGTTHPILTSAARGDEVLILDEQGGWYHVKLQNGTEGYIFGEYVKMNP